MNKSRRLSALTVCLLIIVFCVVILTGCFSNCEHEWGEWKTITPATCTEAGVQEAECVKCGEKKTSSIEALGHEWTSATCTSPRVCSRCELTDGEALGHTFNQEVANEKTLKTEATYDSPAVYYKSCTCGAISTNEEDTFTSGEALVCDHSQFSSETINLADYGGCKSAYIINSCSCGEVKIIDEESSTACFMVEEYNKTVENADGTGTISTLYTCSACGASYESHGDIALDGCFIRGAIYSTITIGDVAVVDSIQMNMETEAHAWQTNYISLADYGGCNGIVTVRDCSKCGEISQILDYTITCEADFTQLPEAVEEIDENGFVHQKYYYQCPNCNLVLLEDKWTEEISACEEISHYKLLLTSGDTVVLEFNESKYIYSHDYTFSYELNGETCEDGVVTTAECSKCDKVYYSASNNHKQSVKVVDLQSEYGCCAGSIYFYQCDVCGMAMYVDDRNIGCSLAEETVETTDENGNVHTVSTRNCELCNLVYVVDTWQAVNECEVVQYFEARNIYSGDELIVQWITKVPSEDHKIEIIHEFLGDNCEDGLMITVRCTVCGFEQQTINYNHSFSSKNIDLSEYGGCGGYIFYTYCRYCNETLNIPQVIYYCNMSNESDPVEIVLENGVVAERVTSSCSICGMKIESDRWAVVSGCEETIYSNNRLYFGDNLILEYSDAEDYYHHENEISYVFIGETCEDGVLEVGSCTKCGKTYKNFTNSHNLENVTVNLDQYTTCGGEISYTRCVRCQAVTELNEIDFWCPMSSTIENIVGEDGIEREVETLVCDICNLNAIISRWTVQQVDSNEVYYYTQLQLFVGENLILDITTYNIYIQ